MEGLVVSSRNARWGTYGISFLITAAIFATAILVSNYFNAKRTAIIRSTQDSISVDILSLETQFDLLAEHSCADISERSVLSKEIYPLAQRLNYLESQTNVNQDELIRLKRYYSLLQIKDLLLTKRVAAKCNLRPVVILYFYSNAGDCKDCEAQGYALTALSEQYPSLRIYSFDYNLDLSALQTLIQINAVSGPLPALAIKDRAYHGLQSVDDIKKILPELAKLPTATSTATKR